MCETSYVNVQNNFLETNYRKTESREEIKHSKCENQTKLFGVLNWILDIKFMYLNNQHSKMLFLFCIFILCLTFSHRSHTQNRIPCCFSFRFVYNWTFVSLEFFNCTQILYSYVLTGTFDHLDSVNLLIAKIMKIDWMIAHQIASIGKWLWNSWNILKWKIETIFCLFSCL